MCSFDITTDADAGETTWEIVDDYGNILASGGPYTSQGAQPTQNFNLPNGCYSLYVYDSYGDGIINGGYTLRDANGDIIHQKYNFSSTKDQDYFQTSLSTSTKKEFINQLSFYPNPTEDLISLSNVVEEIMIYNNLGVLVFHDKNKSKVSLGELSNGHYSLVMKLNGNIYQKALILAK
jgi:hypothetical protein